MEGMKDNMIHEVIDSREPFIADAEWEAWLDERRKLYPLPEPEYYEKEKGN